MSQLPLLPLNATFQHSLTHQIFAANSTIRRTTTNGGNERSLIDSVLRKLGQLVLPMGDEAIKDRERNILAKP